MKEKDEEYITHLVKRLPDFLEIRPCPDYFWELMEVNTERVLQDMTTLPFLEEKLSTLGSLGMKLLANWISVDIMEMHSAQDEIEVLAEHFLSQSEQVPFQTILLLSEFLYRRQTVPIETISQVLLSEEIFSLIFEHDTDDWTKRFCYTLFVFLQQYDNLRLLLLFENGERVGYVRCTLTPITERGGQELSDEDVQQVEAKIKAGVDLALVTSEHVDTVLEEFESSQDGRRSRCFGVIDEPNGTKLVFILREWREAIVRQVDNVVFADEAELIVLRLKQMGIQLEEHGSSTVSRPIAAAIIGSLLSENKLQYLKDTQVTDRMKLDDLLNKHMMADVDDQIRLQELYLYNSEVDQAPLLILRCGKKETLTKPIVDLRKRGIDLLANLDDIRHIKIAFVINHGERFEKSYIFKVFFKSQKSGDFFLPYSVANVPTRLRAKFEHHLWSNYHVRIIPGT